jgi:hypothetical protein
MGNSLIFPLKDYCSPNSSFFPCLMSIVSLRFRLIFLIEQETHSDIAKGKKGLVIQHEARLSNPNNPCPGYFAHLCSLAKGYEK